MTQIKQMTTEIIKKIRENPSHPCHLCAIQHPPTLNSEILSYFRQILKYTPIEKYLPSYKAPTTLTRSFHTE